MSSPSSSENGKESVNENGDDDYTVTVDWEVDLTRPETLVVSKPGAVTTAGFAVFQFACALDGEEPEKGCLYEYQMVAVNRGVEGLSEVDWNSLDWLPTVSEARPGVAFGLVGS